jgi:hypothetical protein
VCARIEGAAVPCGVCVCERKGRVDDVVRGDFQLRLDLPRCRTCVDVYVSVSLSSRVASLIRVVVVLFYSRFV